MSDYIVTSAEGASSVAAAKPWGQFAAPTICVESSGRTVLKPFGQLRTPIAASVESASTPQADRAWFALWPAVVSAIEGASTPQTVRTLGIPRSAAVGAAEGAAGASINRVVAIAEIEGQSGLVTARPWGEVRVAITVGPDSAKPSIVLKPFGQLRTMAIGAESSAGATVPVVLRVGLAECQGGAAASRPWVAVRSAVATPPDVFAATILSRTFYVSAVEGFLGQAIIPPLARYRLDARGLFRVFGEPEYRFYRSRVGPPTEGFAPFATSASLPFEPAETFDDGAWYLSVSYFNGVLDSGFLPLGPGGETYLLLTVADGSGAVNPPAGPLNWRIAAAAGGAVRVIGLAVAPSPAPPFPQQWAIATTDDGSEPPADLPDLVQDMPLAGLCVLDCVLPASEHGATVSVRLQVRRNDGSVEEPQWVYSAGSTVLSVMADALGPAAPTSAERWVGQLVESGE